MANIPVHKDALPPAAAARRLGIGRTKLYELIGSGTLRSFRIGKARRIRTEDIEALRQTDLAAAKPDPERFSCCCAMVLTCATRVALTCQSSPTDGCRAGTRLGRSRHEWRTGTSDFAGPDAT
jgi:excisionase family DNA binding protein